MVLISKRWQGLMVALGLPENDDIFGWLTKAYGEPHRYYHGLSHLEHCLVLADEVRDLLQSPLEVELALWFHDAVYQPHSRSNELDSAAWLQCFLEKGDRPVAEINRIYGHILATKHHSPTTDPDRQFVMDIDLAILGSSAAEFQAFERNIRKEYEWVPWKLYCHERLKVLRSLGGWDGQLNAARSPIFQTDYFRERYETQAEQNLTQAIIDLQQSNSATEIVATLPLVRRRSPVE